MALFSDGPPSTIEDLAQQDSYLLNVVGVEGINLTNKLQLAYNEVSVALTVIFGREASIYDPVLGETPLDVTNLSVTPALQLWHTFKSLELVYRDAYFNQLSDRYQGKWKQFEQLANLYCTRFIDTGAGIVVDPLPMPGPPVITLAPASQAGGIGYLSVTFVNAEAQESSPAVTVQQAVPDGNVIVVSAPVWPSNAVGWNFYGGVAPSAMTLQNTSPLTLGGSFQFLLPGTTTGQAPGTGQGADVTRDLPRRIMRG
jgi:hypothetical protein